MNAADLVAYPPRRPTKKTPPYAIAAHRHDQDIVADARAELRALNQGLLLEAGLDEEGECPSSTTASSDDTARGTAMSDAFRDLIASVVADSVNNGSGAPMLAHDPYVTDVSDDPAEFAKFWADDEPVEGDEHWIPGHDDQPEPVQDGWHR